VQTGVKKYLNVKEHLMEIILLFLNLQDNEILLCLHKEGEHLHPTMTNQSITPGNGLILYFRTDIDCLLQNVKKQEV